MTRSVRFCLRVMAMAFLSGAIAAICMPANSNAATPAEALYAELAKLSPAERQTRLVEGAKKEGKLSFTYSTSEKIGRDLHKDLAKTYPWLNYAAQHISDPVAMEQLVTEEAANRHLTDALNGSIATLVKPLQHNLLASYPTPAADRILPRYKIFLDPENRWLPKMWSEHGIVYNPDMVKAEDAPKNFMDLCNPRFKGQVSFDPIRARVVNYIYLVFDGDMKKVEEWMKCMGANDPIMMKGHTTRLMLMLAGDHAVSGDQFIYRGTMLNQKNPKKAPFKAVYEEVILAAPSVVIINKNTTRPHSAALYVDWNVSDGAQQVFKNHWRGPVTLQHPYMPDDAKLVVANVPDPKLLDELFSMWRKYFDVKG